MVLIGFTTLLPRCLLFLVAISIASVVSGQEVQTEYVRTEYIVVKWTKALQWENVTEYSFTFTVADSVSCVKPVMCYTEVCGWNSSDCGTVNQCTPVSLVVQGGNYTTEPLALVTGPNPVVDLVTPEQANGTNVVSWTNPDLATCYQHTFVQFVFDQRITIEALDHDQPWFVWQRCESGSVEVTVWTKGGDGESLRQHQQFDVTTVNLAQTVTGVECRNLSCSSVSLTWSYTPLCDDARYFYAGTRLWGKVDLSSREVITRDLQESMKYNGCVKVVDRGLQQLGEVKCADCYIWGGIENLQAFGVNSESLNIRWDPPHCPGSEGAQNYSVSLYGGSEWQSQFTHQLSLVYEELEVMTQYQVCIRPYHHGDYIDSVCVQTSTLPLEVEALNVRARKGVGLEVTWEYTDDETQYYVLEWGPDRQYTDTTQDTNYTITEFDSEDGVGDVCVAAVVSSLTTAFTCMSDNWEEGGKDNYTVPIVVGALLGVLALIGVAMLALHYKKKSRNKANNSTSPDSHNLTPQTNGSDSGHDNTVHL